MAMAVPLVACSGASPPSTLPSSIPTPTATPEATFDMKPYLACNDAFGDVLDALGDIDSRLSSTGISLVDYGTKVGDVKVVIDRIDVSEIAKTNSTCATAVAGPVLVAYGDYFKVYEPWRTCTLHPRVCEEVLGKTKSEIEEERTTAWTEAGAKIAAARHALDEMQGPAPS